MSDDFPSDDDIEKLLRCALRRSVVVYAENLFRVFMSPNYESDLTESLDRVREKYDAALRMIMMRGDES